MPNDHTPGVRDLEKNILPNIASALLSEPAKVLVKGKEQIFYLEDLFKEVRDRGNGTWQRVNLFIAKVLERFLVEGRSHKFKDALDKLKLCPEIVIQPELIDKAIKRFAGDNLHDVFRLAQIVSEMPDTRLADAFRAAFGDLPVQTQLVVRGYAKTSNCFPAVLALLEAPENPRAAGRVKSFRPFRRAGLP